MSIILLTAITASQAPQCAYEAEVAFAASTYPYYVNNVRYTLNPALIRAIITQESGFNPKARSGVGARGLMQVMPGTAELLKCDYSKIEDPATNINCGTKFLAALLTYTKGDLLKALSGYNGGTHSTEKSPLLGGRIADNEQTRAYVKSVLSIFEQYKKNPYQAAGNRPSQAENRPLPSSAGRRGPEVPSDKNALPELSNKEPN